MLRDHPAEARDRLIAESETSTNVHWLLRNRTLLSREIFRRDKEGRRRRCESIGDEA
jgi:hypothetical protein